MKYILFVLCLITLNGFGKNIYVSPNGNNTTGLSPSTAFKTMAKLNATWSTVAPGDFILFERGYTYYGSLKPLTDGNSSNRITIGAYGTGNQPVISGLYVLDGWAANGTNKWIATPDSITKANTNIFTINGVPKAVARTHWMYYYSKVAPDGNNSNFRSSWLVGQPSYVGGEVVIRANVFLCEKGTITSQSSNQIFMSNNTQPIYNSQRQGFSAGTDSMGFFIQRDIDAMDSQDEWYYDKAANRFHLWSTTTPTTKTIKVSYIDTLFYMENRRFYTIQDLTFEGAGVYAIESYSGNSLIIKNCNFVNNTEPIYAWNTGDLWIAENNLTNNLCMGIMARNRQTKRTMIDSNFLYNTGILMGMAIYNTEFSMRGIVGMHDTTRLDNYLKIIGNTVRNTGEGPLWFNGTNVTIRRNWLDTFAYVKDDMGGIYTFNQNSKLNVEIFTNRVIDSNFIGNGIGAPLGSRNGNHIDVAGLYLDDQANNIFAAHNTIYNIAGNAVQMNTPNNIWIRDNTIYNSLFHFALQQKVWGLTSNIKVTKNILVQKVADWNFYTVHEKLDGPQQGWTATTPPVAIYYPATTRDQWIKDMAQIDSNWITNLVTNSYQAITRLNPSSSYGTLNINQATWKSTYLHDLVSVSAPITVTSLNTKLWINPYNTDSVANFVGFKKRDMKGTVYNNIALIPKWSSLLLIDNGVSDNQPPTANAGPDQTKTLPTNTTTLAGSGTDPEGGALSYLWVKVAGSPAGGTISNTAIANPTVSGLIQGVYQYGLTVSDPFGLTASDIVSITVNPAPNLPPTVNAGTDQEITQPLDSVMLTATATDPEGASLTYTWVKVSGTGTAYEIVNPNSASTRIRNMDVGTFDFRVTVSDGVNTTSDIVHIIVNDEAGSPNVAPVADAGPNDEIYLPTNTYNLIGSGSFDSDGSITNYSWSFLAGSPAGAYFSDQTIANPVIGGLVQGTYTAQLIVTDNEGANDNATVIIVVHPQPANIPPTIFGGNDTTIRMPIDTVRLTAVGDDEDSDSTTLAYFWNKISGPVGSVIHNPSSRSTKIQFALPGLYSFGVTTQDDRDGIASDVVNVTVLPPLSYPDVNAGGDLNLYTPATTATLNGTATDADGSIVSKGWVKLSGPSGDVIDHPDSLIIHITGLTQGTYVYELTATDNDGLVTKDRVTVNLYAEYLQGTKVNGWIITPNKN